MSVAFTEQAVIERRKTVTRRKGWQFLKPGERLTLCRKVQGRRSSDGTVEPLVRLAEVEVVSVTRESLRRLYDWENDPIYATREIAAEGFLGMGPALFVHTYFVEAQDMSVDDFVTRIEWRYLDTYTRPSTDTVRLPEGGSRITVKRCCDACGRELGDATEAELDAAVTGRLLPSVLDECGRHAPDAVCTAKDCGRPQSEHEYGVFCP
jgi:hypothetical protein